MKGGGEGRRGRKKKWEIGGKRMEEVRKKRRRGGEIKIRTMR